MAIQFHCPGCSQPIEVDDGYAGQMAACPYCRRVVTVPDQSALEHAPTVPARPASSGEEPGPERSDLDGGATFSTPPPPAPGGLHVGATRTYKDNAARTYGSYAIISTAIAILLFVATIIYSTALAAKEIDPSAVSQPSMEQISQEFAMRHPEISAGLMGAMFFAAVGLALGITSVRQTAKNNWRGIISLVICGFFVLCFCGITGFSILVGG